MNCIFPESILIVKTSAIGDVIQTFPVLEYLRLKFPQAQIDWVAEQPIAPLLQAHPLLNNALEMRSKVWRKSLLRPDTHQELRSFAHALKATSYDVLFDLQGNAKSAVVTASARAKVKVGFGYGGLQEKCNLLATHRRFTPPTNLNIRLKYLSLVQSYFKDPETFVAQGVRLKIHPLERERLQKLLIDPILQKRPRMMVCFGSRWPNKRLDLATLSALLEKIVVDSDPSYLFIFSNAEEKQIAELMQERFKERAISIGDLSLPLWQALMWEMDGVIAVDSAALHLCATTQTPSFSVFGPSLASCYRPLEERHSAVQGSCPYGKTFSQRCPILRTCATGACIRQLSVEELFSACKQWYDSKIFVTTC